MARRPARRTAKQQAATLRYCRDTLARSDQAEADLAALPDDAPGEVRARLEALVVPHGSPRRREIEHTLGLLDGLVLCSECQKPLQDEVSKERGVGPDCWRKLHPTT